MKEATSQQLYAYWNSVRGDRLAPQRFEIEPSRISAILPDTFILEGIDAATARFRLAGTRICEAFATEFRGLNIFDFFLLEDRAALKQAFASVGGQGAAGVFQIEGMTQAGRRAAFEMLVLPLVHSHEKIDRYMGSITPVSPPAWLGHEPIAGVRLLGCETVWPDGRPWAVSDAMKRQSPFMPHVRSARIVKSDRRQFRVYDGGLAYAPLIRGDDSDRQA